MNDRDPLDDATRLWRSPVIPLQDAERASARRAPTIDAIAGAIQRAANEKRAARRRRWVFSAGFAAAAAVAVALGIPSLREGNEPVAGVTTIAEAARIEAHAGAIEVTGVGVPASVGAGDHRIIVPGDVVSTRAGTAGTVVLSRSTRLDLAASTRLSVVALESPTGRVRLEQGHLDARVDGPREDGEPKLVVETPDAVVVVVGTVFTVDVSARSGAEPGLTAVAVMRGTVAIQRGGLEVARISAGQTWSSKPTVGDQASAAPPGQMSPETSTRGGGPLGAPRPRAPATDSARADASSGTLALENDLFARAMAARNAGRDHDAVELFAALLARYPASPLAEDARLEQQRARARLP